MDVNKVRLFFRVMIIFIFLQGTGFAAPTEAIAASPDEKPAASEEGLAKKSQNPIADIMSLPIQYNYYTGGALGNSTMSVINIQPVIPTQLNKDWNLITRAIIPLISMPTPAGTVSGVGDSSVSFFFSPKKPGAVTWGVGPIFQVPTASDPALGTQTFGVGPTAVVVAIKKNWVYGALANYVTTVGTSSTGLRTNLVLIQPFVNYNIPNRPGLALSFVPIITCDLTRSPGDQWTVPLGLQASQIVKFDKQPVNVVVGAYYNAVRPVNAPEWNFRFMLNFLFPK